MTGLDDLLSPLSPEELAVYSHAVGRSGMREGEVMLEGISQEEVERAIQCLLERRLLVAVGTVDTHFVAASPEAASDE